MDQEEKLELRRQHLLTTLHQAVDLLLSNGEVRYIVCVRLRDPATQKLMMGMLSNLSHVNEEGVSVPATPGMLMDIILEAMLEGPEIDGPEQVQMPKNPYKM